ncbi:hypothetical protein Y032_0049g1799 [Ancylostoma ceylanicum]|uniref:Uncharacterized protein n=1 Tax=Ancylostoma ceylanicum TaxID=53326 RepID=A0A016UB32_9BILA|nr:hypothetical protein Y032_0049g1799 [Ancylostoma ceylanicum]
MCLRLVQSNPRPFCLIMTHTRPDQNFEVRNIFESLTIGNSDQFKLQASECLEPSTFGAIDRVLGFDPTELELYS